MMIEITHLVRITGIPDLNPGLIVDARDLYVYGVISDTTVSAAANERYWMKIPIILK